MVRIVLGVLCSVLLAFIILPSAPVLAPALSHAQSTPKRMIVLGVDGMDPDMLRQFMDQGSLPHLSRLASQGGFMPLGTSIPPQSPVAWSEFITGMDPGGHGLFDFIALDRKTLLPYLSSTRVEGPSREPLKLGSWRIPLGSEQTVLLRDGTAFWELLSEAGIPTTVFRIPANYPPVPVGDGRALSGMGTPDLRGSSGTFSYFTNDPAFKAGDVSGGVIEQVVIENGTVRAFIEGPPNAFQDGAPATQAAFSVYVDPQNPVSAIQVGDASDERVLLNVGEWSRWVSVNFELVPGLVNVQGMVRFFLKQTTPHFGLYVSPVNIDPREPAQQIAEPATYAAELAQSVGPFYTQEMPEDTKALSAHVLNGQEFLAQSGLVLDERRRLLRHELDWFQRQKGSAFLFFYLSSIDQRNHMLYRHVDSSHPSHPAHPPHQTDAEQQLKQAMHAAYQEVDEIIGWLLDSVDEQTALIVMSDHGFAPFRRQAHLNAWLEQNGYLHLRNPRQRRQVEWLQGIRWRRTRAFAIGLNSLYLNVRGREHRGAVAPNKRAALAREIADKLLEWRDPELNQPVVTQAVLREEVYHGPHVDEAPDIIVGYARGYRASWDTTTGKVPTKLIEDNMGEWSGDHCMDSRAVPGVLLVNRHLRLLHPVHLLRPLQASPANLRDLTVSILRYFGVSVPAQMQGQAVFLADVTD